MQLLKVNGENNDMEGNIETVQASIKPSCIVEQILHNENMDKCNLFCINWYNIYIISSNNTSQKRVPSLGIIL